MAKRDCIVVWWDWTALKWDRIADKCDSIALCLDWEAVQRDQIAGRRDDLARLREQISDWWNEIAHKRGPFTPQLPETLYALTQLGPVLPSENHSP